VQRLHRVPEKGTATRPLMRRTAEQHMQRRNGLILQYAVWQARNRSQYSGVQGGQQRGQHSSTFDGLVGEGVSPSGACDGEKRRRRGAHNTDTEKAAKSETERNRGRMQRRGKEETTATRTRKNVLQQSNAFRIIVERL
jgi:hypothetical protein